jgi:hypothetical protein
MSTGEMRALWWGIAAGPVAWSADELASLYFHEASCNVFGGPRLFGLPAASVALVLIGLAAGALAASGAVTAFRARARLGRDTGEGPTRPDQRRFMAHAGIILSLIFFFGIVLRFMTTFFLAPCRSL